jgi:hypothetical protein
MDAEVTFTPSRKTPGRARGYIENYRPQAKTRTLLDDVRQVLDAYRNHWPLTCRQIYYRLIGAHGYPKTEDFYKKLCHHLANARRGSVVDFDAIRDEGISTVSLDHFDGEEHFKQYVRLLGRNYKRNLLAGQPMHIEVWCEAAGMIFQLAQVAHEYSIPVYSSSGFDSLTKALADRICEIDKPTVILHLGDFDPSGESIFNSAAEDVQAFVEWDRTLATTTVKFQRVALTADQVREFGLPTAPPKVSDSRARTWSGDTCQLEALPPDQIADLVREAIVRVLDHRQLQFDRHLEGVEKVRIAVSLPAPGGAA